MNPKDSFCSFCGTPFPPPLKYPRACTSCSIQIWANPIPVCVVLAPIVMSDRTGLLVVRRGIQPGLGKLALVGGFLEEHESWQDGAAREVREETGVHIKTPSPFWYASSSPKPNRVLLFSIAPPIQTSDIAAFQKNAETAERGVIFGPGGLADVFAFSLHEEAARRYFEEKKISAEHGYIQI
jgi:ADP-ribose pyrophosphatase YjhB (NUDIX family)